MSNVVDVATFEAALARLSVTELCDAYTEVGQRRARWAKFAATALMRELERRDDVAYLMWVLDMGSLGFSSPNKFFMP